MCVPLFVYTQMEFCNDGLGLSVTYEYLSRGMRFPTMWYVRPAKLRAACAYAQSDQSLCKSLEYSMSVQLLTEHN